MQFTKKYQVGLLLFIGAFILLLICASAFNAYSGAMCAAICWPLLIAVIALAFIGCGFFFSENDLIDTSPVDTPFKISYGWSILAVLVFVGFLLCKPIKPMISMYNQNIEYTNKYDRLQQEKKLFFDKMWKTYLQKNEICALNRETFIEVTAIIMEGRADGENVSWKMVHENQQIPYEEFSSFYRELSAFVTAQREDYYKLEAQTMELVQRQNEALDKFPNNLYNEILGIKKLEYKPGFTSTRTEEVFETGVEDL